MTFTNNGRPLSLKFTLYFLCATITIQQMWAKYKKYIRLLRDGHKSLTTLAIHFNISMKIKIRFHNTLLNIENK